MISAGLVIQVPIIPTLERSAVRIQCALIVGLFFQSLLFRFEWIQIKVLVLVFFGRVGVEPVADEDQQVLRIEGGHAHKSGHFWSSSESSLEFPSCCLRSLTVQLHLIPLGIQQPASLDRLSLQFQ